MRQLILRVPYSHKIAYKLECIIKIREHHGHKIVYNLKCAIVTCRILYRATYNKIEQKSGVEHNTVRKIVIRAIE